MLENCAREPEIFHLCRFLRKMGASIQGEGSGVICIQGKGELCPAETAVPADRIVAGTYLLAGAATRGKVELKGAPAEEMEALLSVYRKMGGQYEVKSGTLFTGQQPVGRDASQDRHRMLSWFSHGFAVPPGRCVRYYTGMQPYKGNDF